MNDRQQRAIARLSKLLQVWRSRAVNNVRDSNDANAALAGEVSAMAATAESMKSRMAHARAAHLARLKALSSAAAGVKSRLSDAAAAAERLLLRVDSMRPLESASERNDPFASTRTGTVGLEIAPAGSLACTAILGARADGDAAAGLMVVEAGAPATAAAALGLEYVAPGADEALAEADALVPFYGRYNKALLETFALQRRQERLRAENAELTNALQQVLDTLAVTPGAVDGPNPLLVINGRFAPNGGAGCAIAPDKAAFLSSVGATGAPLGVLPSRLTNIAGGGGATTAQRPGAPGVATVKIDAREALLVYGGGGARVVGGHR